MNFWIFAVSSVVLLYLLGLSICHWYVRKNQVVNKKLCWNPLKWGSVLLGFIYKIIFPPHVLEQYVLRFYDSECRQCIKRGECVFYDENGEVRTDKGCGCAMPEKAYVPFECCYEGNWGPIMWNKKKYNDHREKYPINITVEYLTETNKQ